MRRKKAWLSNEYIAYAADMNVALAYFKAMDDRQDDHSVRAQLLGSIFGKSYDRIRQQYPRQCEAIRDCIAQINRLEAENCPNPDLPANAFGKLMGELLVVSEDLWASTLRAMGVALGRFIYLADAVTDYRRDRRRHHYNPYIAMGMGEHREHWEEHLVLAMAACTHEFEKLPLVQDKDILDNILYRGVWGNFRQKKQERRDGV